MKQTNLLQDMLGPTEGHLLEYIGLPLMAVGCSSFGACAIWAATAGSLYGVPSWGVYLYLLISSVLGVCLTSLYKTDRVDGPGRQFEWLVLMLIPLIWHWVMKIATGVSPPSLPVMGLKSGIVSTVYMGLLGISTWVYSTALGRYVSDTWPSVDRHRRILWLMEVEPESNGDEERDRVALESKERIGNVASSMKIYGSLALGFSLVLIFVTLLRRELLMENPQAFITLSILQGITALSSVCGYNLSLNKLDWAMHKTKIETRVLMSWLSVGILTLALVIPIGNAVHLGVERIPIPNLSARIRTETPHIAIPERLKVKATGDSKETQNENENPDKAKKKVKATDQEKKKVTPPGAVRTLWNLLATLIAFGVIATSAMMALSLVVMLLLFIVKYLPEFSGALGGVKKGAWDSRPLLKSLAWPFIVVGEFLYSGVKELGAGFKHLLRDSLFYRMQRWMPSPPNGRKGSATKGHMGRIGKPSNLSDKNDPSALVKWKYHQILYRASRKGMDISESETPSELVPKLSNPPEISDLVDRVTKAYEETRYGKKIPEEPLLKSVLDWVSIVSRKLKPFPNRKRTRH